MTVRDLDDKGTQNDPKTKTSTRLWVSLKNKINPVKPLYLINKHQL